MSVFARLKKAREEKKGFTLVELIVVLVILAILAAILVPALLGWIDKAKEKQYVLDARSVYMAAQAVADEAYASNALKDGTTLETYLKGKINEICVMSDVSSATIVKVTTSDGTDLTNATDHKAYVIAGMTVNVHGKDVTLKDGTWVMGNGC